MSRPLRVRSGAHLPLLFVLILLAGCGILAAVEYPAWWSHVVKMGASPDDYAAINQGQLKNFALGAYLECEASFPSYMINEDLTALIDGFTKVNDQGVRVPKPGPNTDDYSAVNLGQLKAVAKAFYDQLAMAGFGNVYPWPTSGNADDYALANIGQAKRLFSFNLLDSDFDGMLDWWEIEHGLDPYDGADGSPDPDSDGLSNLAEFYAGTDPYSADTDADGMPDEWEYGYLLNPRSSADAFLDLDGDGINNLDEYRMALDPTMPGSESTLPTANPQLDSGRGNDVVLHWDTGGDPRVVALTIQMFDPVTGSWISLQNSTSSSGSVQVTDVTSAENQQFQIVYELAGGGTATSKIAGIEVPLIRAFEFRTSSARFPSSPAVELLLGGAKRYFKHVESIYEVQGAPELNSSFSYTWDPVAATSTIASSFVEDGTGTSAFDDTVKLQMLSSTSFSETYNESYHNISGVLITRDYFRNFDILPGEPASTTPWTVSEHAYLGGVPLQPIPQLAYMPQSAVDATHPQIEPGWQIVNDSEDSVELQNGNKHYLWARSGELSYNDMMELTIANLQPHPQDFDDPYPNPYFWIGGAGGNFRNQGWEGYHSEVEATIYGLLPTYPLAIAEYFADDGKVSRIQFRLSVNPCRVPQTRCAVVEFLPTDDPRTPEVDESGPAEGVAIVTLSVASGESVSSVGSIDPLAIDPEYRRCGKYSVSISPFELELDSRDRGIVGAVRVPTGWQGFSLKFEAAGKDLGTYDLTDDNSTYIYNSQNEFFTEDEVTRYENNDADTLRVINQKIAFFRDGEKIRFTTISDDLGTLKITLILNGQEIGSVQREMTAEEDFRRVIAAVAGMVAGEDPPAIKAWEEYPSYEEPSATPPPGFEAPPLTDVQLDSLRELAPAEVNWLIPPDNEILKTPEGFFAFVQLAKRTFENANDQQSWNGFTIELVSGGFDPEPVFGNFDSTANGGHPGWSNPPPATTRTEIALPATIANRSLVAKALILLIKRTFQSQLASVEGCVFGLWDGVKGDVDGVIDMLRMPGKVEKFIEDFLKEPYKVAGEIYHTLLAIKKIGWAGVVTNVKAMLAQFVQVQGDRLTLVLSSQAQDPIFLASYMAGYLAGYVGEQVAVGILTAGIAKIGVVGKALAKGAQAAEDLIGIAKSVYGPVAEGVQKLSKGFANDFARVSRSADEVRAARRNASLCRSVTGCIAAGTLVVMGNGSLKAIDDVRTNDMVMADDPTDDDPPAPRRVLAQVRNTAGTLYRVSWDKDGDGAADAWLDATSEHPFWTVEDCWRPASRLTPGMTLCDREGHDLIVCSVEKIEGVAKTFNIDVEGPSTFFASANGSSVLLHNLEGDVYLYEHPFRAKGQSQVFNPSGQAVFWPDGSPKVINNPEHHFHFDAWLKRNFTNYTSRMTPFPCIELTWEQHVAAHAAGEQWLLMHYNRRSTNMNEKWLEVSIESMNELAEHMAAAARAKGAAIDSIKIGTLKNWSNAHIADYAKHHGCKW